MRLNLDDFSELVKRALDSIPPKFRHHLENVVVEVQETPSRQDCEAMEIDDPGEMLGIYHGTPLTDRSVEMDGYLPDRITLFQRNIEDICETRDEIVAEIRTTVLHEIGHYFGLDEEDLFEVGYD